MNTQKRNQTAAYFIAFITLGLASAALGPALPYLAAQTGSELSQISILFTAKATGYLLGSLIGGRFYDRLPGHKVMFVGLIGMVLTVALTPVVPMLWFLVLVLFFLGLTFSDPLRNFRADGFIGFAAHEYPHMAGVNTDRGDIFGTHCPGKGLSRRRWRQIVVFAKDI